MTPRSEWLGNKQATARVKELLEKAGLPLELAAWSEAEEFRRRVETEDLHVRTERIVYGPTDESALREVDFCTTLYQEFQVSDVLGIQLILEVVLECKYREDVEVFGFPRPDKLGRPPAFPVVTDLAGSDLATRLGSAVPMSLAANILGIGLVKIDKGRTPKSPIEERLDYRAGAQLYDYITTALAPEDAEEPGDLHPTVKALLDSFVSYVRENHFAWWSVLRRWKREQIGTSEVKAFNQWAVGRKGPLYTSVTAYLPVLCQNGPIYSVRLTHAGKPRAFTPEDYLVTGLRVPRWPAAGRGRSISVTPEVPLVVTNVSGISQVLESSLQWFAGLRQLLQNAPAEEKERAYLEAEFCQAVRQRFQENESLYRSDYDVETWL
jgi:hypothetical protein